MLGRFVPPDSGKRVIEIGCGTGGNLKALTPRYEAIGVELDAHAAQLARARVSCPVHCGDFREVAAGELPAQDAVLLADVLEHVEDDRGFLADLTGSLRPGAIVLLTVPADPALWSAHDVALGHYRRYGRETLTALWRGLPVELLFDSAFNSLLYPAIRLARRLRGGREAGRTDLAPVHPLVNALLYHVFAAERHALARRGFSRGCSLLAVLRRTPHA